jgi:quercetin dioxygenase-like cupin family protein
MSDSSVQKVQSAHSPVGAMGQKYLATGISLGMRLWEDVAPGEAKAERARPYETAGYVIRGIAELHLEGQVVRLEPGDSWIVPKGSTHTFKIIEPFTAVEATTPPASAHGRDEE